MSTLGETLKRERMRQGLEIRDVEEAISIRALYLNAIEEGNYKIVPGEVYLKGFIRNYAIHLGLDPQQMLEIYRQDKDMLPRDERLPEEAIMPPKSAEPAQKARKYQRRREERREERRKSSSSMKWVIILLIAAGALAWGVMNFTGLSIWPPTGKSAQLENTPLASIPEPAGAAQSNQPNQANQPNQPSASGESNPPATAGQGSQQPGTAAQPAGSAVTLAAKFIGRCWTQVNVDGKLKYEGTPKIGETLTFNGGQRIFIKLGNASAVELTHNGKPLGVAGKNGEVIIKTFTKDAETSVSSQ